MPRILVVDDEKSIRLTLKAFLQGAGYAAVTAGDADEALAALAQDDIDVVLTDIILPKHSGIELLGMIREKASRVPVILMTGEPTLDTAAAAVRGKAFDYLSKPITKEVVVEAVAAAVKENEREHELERLRELERRHEEELERLVAERTQGLRESEASFREAQTLAHLGSWSWIVETDTVRWSEELYGIAGRDPQLPPPTYADHSSLYTEESWERLSRAVEKAVHEGEPYELELAMVRPDGDVRWTATRGRPVTDESGRVVRLHGTVHDITERKRAEEALRESETMNRSLLDGSPVCNKIIDLDSKLRYMSAAGVKQLKIPDVEPYYGQTYPPEFCPESMRAPLVKNLNLAKAGKTVAVEAPLHDTEGNEVWFHTTFVPALDDDGEVKYVIASSVEITERKEVEIELRERNRLNELLLDSLPHPAMLIRRDRTILAANEIARETGAEIGGFCWQGFGHSELLPEEDRRYLNEHGEAPPDGTRCSFCLADEALDRKEAANSPDVNAFGKIWNTWWIPLDDGIYLHYATDVTEHRQIEERLRQSEKMEAIGQLAGGVAHDFNNQLAGIMNYADLLLGKARDEELRPYIESITRVCTRAGDLTSQLLAFSRKGKYQTVPVNIHATVQEAASMLARGTDRRMTIRQRLDANPPTTTGDPAQLESALLNLGLNARDAMPEGGELVFATDTVTLDEQYCSSSTFDIVPGEYLMISVTDSGLGMDADTRSRVFEPFFTTKGDAGTGMGLASVYGTVINHHGAIEVDSEVGRGTTMTIHLPLSRQEARGETGADTTQTVPGGARILLVDDEKSVRESTAQLLRREGYKVVTCEDGVQAVEYYGRSWKHVDLVILDMNMPVMTGRDVFVAMREMNPDVKALLATGYSLDSRAQEALEEGVISHTQKPFRIHDLVLQIEQALSG